MKEAFRRLLPSLLVLTLAGAVVGRGNEWWTAELVRGTGRIVFALSFLLAWRFHRGRVAWGVAAVALVAEVLARWPPTLETGAALHGTIAVLLPLHLTALAFAGEHRVLSWRGAGWLTVLAAEALLVAGSPSPEAAAWTRALRGPWIDQLPVSWGLLSQPAALSFLLGAIVLGSALRLRPLPVESGWLGALIAGAAALALPAAAPFLVAAGLILGLAIVEGAHALAFEDPLTGLPSRRALDERLRSLSGRYSLAMVDIDRFKNLNDRYGHAVGDQLLRKVAAKLRQAGGGSTAYRYGGEEFVLLFPGGSLREAKTHADALRREIGREPFVVRSAHRPRRRGEGGRGRGGSSSRSIRVRVSIGLASRSERRPSAGEVLKAADRALYRAKRAGRNRLSVVR